MKVKVTLNFSEAKTEQELREQWIDLWEASKSALISVSVVGHEFIGDVPKSITMRRT